MIKTAIKSAFRKVGLQINRVPRGSGEYIDQPDWINDIIQHVKPFTMTGGAAIATLCEAVVYVEKNNIPGDIVECGVWRGGSMMAVALTLLHLQKTRSVYLFDTFEGMTPPTEIDVDLFGRPAAKLLQGADSKSIYRAIASLDEVKRNIARTGYSQPLINYVIGNVEDTIPATAPGQIAILRLDTDWYESTRHELKHLWPRLVRGGIMIIDDYGYWRGSRKAVDEFCDSLDFPLFLSRVDPDVRLVVKP